MVGVRSCPFVDHRETLLRPSRKTQLPKCSREALQESKQYSTYVVSDISGQAIEALGKTKKGNLRRFATESALNDARAKKKRRFVVQKGSGTQFFVSDKKGAKKVRNLHDKNSSNWTTFLKAGLLGYLASGCVPGAAAATYQPGAPFPVSTSVSNVYYAPPFAQLENGNIVYTWGFSGRNYFKVITDKNEVASPEQPFTPVDRNRESKVVSLPESNYLLLWNDPTQETAGARTKGQLVFQKYNSTNNPIGSRYSFRNPGVLENQTFGKGILLPDGRIVVVWTEKVQTGTNSYVGYGYQSILDANTLMPIGNPTLVANDLDPGHEESLNVIPRKSGWAILYAKSQHIKQQLFNADGSRLGGVTIINSQSDGSHGYEAPKSITLSNGDYIVFWYKWSKSDRDIVGYYYKRFNDNGVAIDTEDQVLAEGSFGQGGTSEEHPLETVIGPSGESFVFIQSNDTIAQQKFSPLGEKEGELEEIVSRGIARGYKRSDVRAAPLSDGYGISWRNDTGLFSQLWKMISPAPTSSPTPAPVQPGSLMTVGTPSSSSTVKAPTSSATTSIRPATSPMVPVNTPSKKPVQRSGDAPEPENLGIIIGAVVAVAFSIAASIALIAALIFKKKRKRSQSTQMTGRAGPASGPQNNAPAHGEQPPGVSQYARVSAASGQYDIPQDSPQVQYATADAVLKRVSGPSGTYDTAHAPFNAGEYGQIAAANGPYDVPQTPLHGASQSGQDDARLNSLPDGVDAEPPAQILYSGLGVAPGGDAPTNYEQLLPDR